MKDTVIITGGSRGIGKSIAMELAQLGYDIAILYEKSTETAQKVAKEIEEKFKVSCILFQVSVSDIDGITKCVKVLKNQGRKLVGLINNAGIIRDGFLMTMPEDDWLEVINTNIFGTLNCTKAVLPVMKENGGGIIVNLSSASGLKGETGQVNYAATKSAILAYTRALSIELLDNNIQVFAIAPGFIETEMVKTMAPKILEKNRENIPMHRLGTTEDVTKIIRFLFIEKPDYMPGHIFVPDGGLTCI